MILNLFVFLILKCVVIPNASTEGIFWENLLLREILSEINSRILKSFSIVESFYLVSPTFPVGPF